MKNIIIINFTDQILSLNSQIKIDEYPNFENLKITDQQSCFVITNSISDIPEEKNVAKLIDESNINFYLITIHMEPQLIEKSPLNNSVKAIISGLNQKNLMTKLDELISMV